MRLRSVLAATLAAAAVLPAAAQADVVGKGTTKYGTTTLRIGGETEAGTAMTITLSRSVARTSRRKVFEVQCRRGDERYTSRVTIMPLSNQRRLFAPGDGASAGERCRVRRGSTTLATMTMRRA